MTHLEAVLRDQGNAGCRHEASPTPEADVAASSICAQHKIPFTAVEVATHRPLCVDCMAAKKRKVKVQTFDEAIAALDSLHAALSAELDKQTVKLTERTFTADELRSRTAKWGAAETARIRAWEEREVKHVHAVANETVELVQEVCARRIEVGAGLITQRAGLLASVEEFGQALANLPREPVAQLTKKRAVYAERKRLCELLAESKIDVPSARAVIEWIEPPALSAEFDEKAAATGGHLASSVFAGAKATLARARRTPGTPLREFPAVPKLVRCVDTLQPRPLLDCMPAPFLALSCWPSEPLSLSPRSHPTSLAGRSKGPAVDPSGRQAERIRRP